MSKMYQECELDVVLVGGSAKERTSRRKSCSESMHGTEGT